MIGCILARCVACALAVGSGVSIEPDAAAGPSLLEQGEADLERGELREAAQAFGAHYRSLPRDQRASSAGEYVVMYAAEVYDKAWAKHAEVGDLEASRSLLQEFVRDVESVHGDAQPELTKAARAKLEQLDDAIAEANGGAAPIVEAPPPTTKTVPTERVEKPVTAARDRPGPDPVAIGLFASGGTILAGGIAMLAAGLAQPTTRRFERSIDDRCEADGATPEECETAKESDAVQTSLEEAETSDRNVALGSIAPLVVGVALLVGGGVRLALRKRSQARIGLGSWVRRGGGGAFVSGRF